MKIDGKSQPRIWVSCLAAYNNGDLHGDWIDADQDPEDIMNEIKKMLAESPEQGAEEWAIHDYEGFECISLSENEDIEKVSRIANLLVEHGPAFAAYYSNCGDIDAAESEFEDAYQGEFKSKEEFAQQIFDECHEIPDYLANYIDYEAIARDMFLGGDYWESDSKSGIYVFASV